MTNDSVSAPGLILHSDRGVQYTCSEFTELLAKNKMVRSNSRKGDCWDNAVAESFFKTLKCELALSLHQNRTRAGLEKVRASGKKLGRPVGYRKVRAK